MVYKKLIIMLRNSKIEENCDTLSFSSKFDYLKKSLDKSGNLNNLYKRYGKKKKLFSRACDIYNKLLANNELRCKHFWMK